MHNFKTSAVLNLDSSVEGTKAHMLTVRERCMDKWR